MVRSYNVNRKAFIEKSLSNIWTPKRERDFYLQELGNTLPYNRMSLTNLSRTYLSEEKGVTLAAYNVMWVESGYSDEEEE